MRKKNQFLFFALILLFISGTHRAFGQSKVSITSKTASEWHICSEGAWIEFNVRNVTTSTLSGLEAEITLPTGMVYTIDSFSGTGITQQTPTSTTKPKFDLPNIAVTGSSTLRLKIKALCSMADFLAKGGIPQVTCEVSYSGGSVNHSSVPLTVEQPSLKIDQITNQYVVKDLKDILVRRITLTNSGKGRVDSLRFWQNNGNSLKLISISGGQTTQNGTQTNHIFSASDFNSVGDNDDYLEQNESVIVLDSFEVIRCKNLNSDFRLTWGCEGTTCFTQTSNGLVTISNKKPKLEFKVIQDDNLCFDSTDANVKQIQIVNTGDYAARNGRIDIFNAINIGFHSQVLSKIDTSTIYYHIGAQGSHEKMRFDLIDYVSNAAKFQCLGPNAIGRVILLLPDIEVGDTVFLNWKTASCCPGNTCAQNFYFNRWKYKASYQDQCLTDIFLNETWGSYGGYQYMRFNEFAPTDVLDKDTVQFTATVTNASLASPSARSELKVVIKLPKGATHSLNSKDLHFETHAGGEWNPNTITKSNDTITAVFRGSPKIMLVRSELIIRFVGDCSSKTDNASSNYEVNVYYNPDNTCTKGCEFQAYCYTGTLKTHCSTTCSGGLRFSSFEIERSSYGLPDSDNDGLPDTSGTLNLAKIKKERVMYGDTFSTVMTGKINSYGSTTSWSFLTAESTFQWGRYIEVVDVSLDIFRNGGRIWACTNLPHTFSTTGNNRTFKYDLSIAVLTRSCITASTYRYTSTDSVSLKVRYKVSTNAGNFFNEGTVSNEFYLHTVRNPTSTQKYQCDTFYGKYMMSGYYFTNWGPGTYYLDGCSEVDLSQNYYLSVGNCCANYAGGNLFPYEYRNWAKPSKVLLLKPKGFDLVNTRLFDYRTSGTGSIARRDVDTLNALRTSGDTIIYDLEPLFKDRSGTFDLHDDGFYGVFRPKFKPNCEAKNGNTEVEYGFVFKKDSIIDGGYDTMFNAAKDIINYTKPEVTLTPFSRSVLAKSDTIKWTVRISNNSANSTAENVWLSQSANANVQLIEIVEVNSQTAIRPDYGIFKLGDLNMNSARVYEIRASFENCNPDSMELLMGYNCSGYPDSLKAAQCIDKKLFLLFAPINTRLETSIGMPLDSISLCSTYTHTVTVSNQNQAKAYNLFVDLYMKQGMVIGDTIYLSLPGRTDSIPITAKSLQKNGAIRIDVSSADTSFAKQGLNGNSSKDNWFRISYTFNTSCDFVSNTLYFVRPGGELDCGDQVVSPFAFSKPIDIKGVKKPYFSDVQFYMDPLDACNHNEIGKITFLNLGPDSTGSNDRLQLLLPAGFAVDTNYNNGIHNNPGRAFYMNGKQNQVYWQMPAGVAPGDSIVFHYKSQVTAREVLCEEVQTEVLAVVDQPALCVSSGQYCNIKVATSTASRIDSIQKGNYRFDFLNGIAKPSGTGDSISLTYRVNALGSDKDSGTALTIRILEDKNKNGQLDATDVLIARDTIYAGITKGSSYVKSLDFFAIGNASCNIMLALDSNACACDMTFQKMPPIRLLNAGADLVNCSEYASPIGLPANSSYTYTWSPARGIENIDSSATNLSIFNSGRRDSTYQYVLTTERGPGCITTDTIEATIRPGMLLPLPTSYALCKGNSIIIGEIATGGSGRRSYLWSPADSLSKIDGPKTFASPLQNTMYTLTVTDDIGCQKVDSTLVEVRDKPDISFIFSDTCSYVAYEVLNTTTDALDSLNWALDGVLVSTNEDLSFTPNASTSQKITFYGESPNGCWDTLSKWTQPYAVPSAAFVFSPTCQNDSAQFLNRSSISTGFLNYEWSDLQGQATSTHLTRLYSNAGNIEVSLMASSPKGCLDTAVDTIQVFENASLSIMSENSCQEERIEWVGKASLQGQDSITSYTWTYNGQTHLGDTLPLTNSVAESISIQLTTATNNGCVDSISRVWITNPNPLASFSYDDTCMNQWTAFTNTSSIATGTVDQITWELDNVFIGQQENWTRKFTSSGFKEILLVAESDSGCVDSFTKRIHIRYAEEPNLSVLGNCVNEDYVFNWIPVEMDSVQNFNWYEDGTLSSTANSLTTRFSTPGTQNIRLSGSFISGCGYDTTFDVQVSAIPNADFNISLPCADDSAVFTDASTAGTGNLIKHTWRLIPFGFSADQNTGISFGSTGTFDIELAVENTAGCRDSITKQVSISDVVTPDFSARDTCALDSQLFTETSSGRTQNIIGLSWEFGNGGVGQGSPFTYAYPSEGVYNVKMTFQTSGGCVYETSKPVTIHPLPIPGFNLSPRLTDILNSDITVSDQSSGATQYLYTLSDGSSFTTPDFTYSILDTGLHVVTQRLTSEYGCQAEWVDEVYVAFVYNILIPNAFSPNQDDLNDVFKPEGLGINAFDLSIYNRWGEKVYDSDNSNGWDGQDALPGVYMYQMRVVDFGGVIRHYSGTVYLIK
jgi:gliding motility-associated-like protein